MIERATPHGHREIVVIGASAGGLEALTKVVRGLPAGFPGAVFVVVHQSPDHRSHLPQILERIGRLPAALATHGDPIVRGKILIAPPDNHLVLRRGTVSVVRGPKENGHRPSVDALFRSAATHYGESVIGVVLSGALDCGTGGLLHIKSRGGVTLVQDPDDAVIPSMPESAIRHVRPDIVAPAAELAQVITRLVMEPVPVGGGAERSGPVRSSEQPSDVVCPLCNGTMTESAIEGFTQVRCHVGHSFSIEGLMQAQFESLEAALWAGVRALEETARVARRAAYCSPAAAAALQERAANHEHFADVIRRMLLADGWPTPREAVEAQGAPRPPEEQAG